MTDSGTVFIPLGCSQGLRAYQKQSWERSPHFCDTVQVSKFKYRKEVARQLAIFRDSGLGHFYLTTCMQNKMALETAVLLSELVALCI